MNFNGAPYPVLPNPKGLMATQSGINQVKSDLLILLMTNPGERVMLPDYGTPLRKLIFDPNDATLEEQTKQLIIDSIRKWEPRVTISQINVTSTPNYNELDINESRDDDGHILMIQIQFFDPENIQDLQELRLELPLSGG